MLVQLARSADERMEQQLGWINQLGEAQADTEVKMAALTDAQIKTDEALSSLADRLERLAESQERLAEAQAQSSEAQARSSEGQARLNDALSRLAEAQAHSDQRLDALIDIVREGRNGKS